MAQLLSTNRFEQVEDDYCDEEQPEHAHKSNLIFTEEQQNGFVLLYIIQILRLDHEAKVLRVWPHCSDTAV